MPGNGLIFAVNQALEVASGGIGVLVGCGGGGALPKDFLDLESTGVINHFGYRIDLVGITNG